MINVLLLLSFISSLLGLTVLKSTNFAPKLFQSLGSIPHHDKYIHFILVGILTYLTSTVFSPTLKQRGYKYPLLLLGLLLSIVISIEEISQAYVPTRTCSWQDVACGVLGIALALNIYHIRELRTLTSHT